MINREIADKIIANGRNFMKGYGEHTLYEKEYESAIKHFGLSEYFCKEFGKL